MRHRQPYPAEFKAKLVGLVRAGRTPEKLSRGFEPWAQAIANWVKQADAAAGKRRHVLSSDAVGAEQPVYTLPGDVLFIGDRVGSHGEAELQKNGDEDADLHGHLLLRSHVHISACRT